MRIPSSTRRARTVDSAAMTPMIDVVFLLLIFFVCASAGQRIESVLPTELAAGAVASQQPAAPRPLLGDVKLRLRRAADGTTVVYMKQRTYTDLRRLGDALRALAEAAAEIPVILDTDGDVPVGDLVRVYDLCQAAGFLEISFAVDQRALRGATPAVTP